MATPAIVATYSTNYSTTGTSKTVSVTCAAGEALIVYGFGEKNVNLGAPTASNVTFKSQTASNGSATYGAICLYHARYMPAVSNLTITMTESSGTLKWGFTCLVVQNCHALSGSGTVSGTGAPSELNTQTYLNSALLFLSVDSSAQDGASRTWLTVNGTTPTSGNGLETSYQYIAGTYTAYAALYPDAGAASNLSQPGLSAPSGQTYKYFNAEIVSSDCPIFSTSAWVNYSATTSKTSNMALTSNDTSVFVVGVANVGVRPVNGNDSAITTTMTYGSRPMTSIAKVHSNNGAQGYIEVFTLVSPPTGTSTITVTASASVDLRLEAYAISGVDQGNPISNLQTGYGSSGSASLTFTNPPLLSSIFTAMGSGTNISGTSNGSPTGKNSFFDLQNFNNSSDGGCAANQIIVNPASPTQQAGWTLTSGPWAIIGFTINPTGYFPPGIVYGLGL